MQKPLEEPRPMPYLLGCGSGVGERSGLRLVPTRFSPMLLLRLSNQASQRVMEARSRLARAG
eukprot:5716235-Pyramimonas_sp.AAC.1